MVTIQGALGLDGLKEYPTKVSMKFPDGTTPRQQLNDNMLTEHYVASIQSPLKTPAAGSKDVSIFINELQPLAGQRQAFKRSATAPSCLAVNETHVYAAQAEKAVVHVYHREKGNHEATIPFNEKVTCLTLAISGMVLLLGTEGGRIMAWELATGRLISTPQSHLQAVTCLAVDPTSHYLLSGSRDSNILVWSLDTILSFSSSENTNHNDISPVHSLSSQRGCITSVAIGHGHGQSNIAVSASEDQSAVIWDYKRGVALRTYLLRAIPRALMLDTSDRGFYTTYEDGTIQLIDLYGNNNHLNTLHDESIVTPVQPGEEHVWKAEGQELGEGLSLALSWDGSRLLSGHKSGKIASWDVSKGSFMSIVDTLPGTASNVVMVPVHGLSHSSDSAVRLTEVVKPRISTSTTEGVVPGDYAVFAKFTSRAAATATRTKSRFQSALSRPSFPADLMDTALAELNSGGMSGADMVNGGVEQDEETKKELEAIRAQKEHLLQQVEHLQKLQKASFVQLREKNRALSVLVKEQEHLTEMAKVEHGWDIVDANVEWHSYQQRQKKAGANGKVAKAANKAGKRGGDNDDDETMTDG